MVLSAVHRKGHTSQQARDTGQACVHLRMVGGVGTTVLHPGLAASSSLLQHLFLGLTCVHAA